MSNPFEKHNIKHLSASSLGLYRSEPAMWVMRYLFGMKDEVGASAWRGTAVEGAIDLLLYKDASLQEGIDLALANFDSNALGEVTDKIEKERAAIPGIVAQALELLKPLGMPTARQFKVEHWIDGIEVPIIGFVDYLWPEYLVDLKTTLALPSAPRPDHAVQVTVYTLATGRPAKLAYATPKKGALYDVTDTTDAIWSLKRSAFAVRAMLDRCDDRNSAVNLFSPDFEDFRWNDTNRQAAYEIFGSM